MTFKEFTRACKKDDRMMELLDRCDRSCGPMSDADTEELVARAAAIFDDWQDDDLWEGN